MANIPESPVQEVINGSVELAGLTARTVTRHPKITAIVATALVLAGAIIGPCSDSDNEAGSPETEETQDYCANPNNTDEKAAEELTGQRVDEVWNGSFMVMSEEVTPVESSEPIAERIRHLAACFFVDEEAGFRKIQADSGFAPMEENMLPGGRLVIAIGNLVSIKLPDGGIDEVIEHTLYSIDEIAAANGIDDAGIAEWEASLSLGQDISLPLQSSAEDTEGEAPPETPEEIRRREIMSFAQRWGEYAQAAEDEFGIDAEVLLAQALLASDYGSSILVQDASNLFGMKAHGGDEPTEYWDGDEYPRSTIEVLSQEDLENTAYANYEIIDDDREDGMVEVRVTQLFRDYRGEDAFRRSFLDFADRVTSEPIYADVAAVKGDPEAYIAAYASVGVTDSAYAAKVLDIFGIIKESTEDADPGPPVTPPSPENPGGFIDVDAISFEGFPNQPRDEQLKSTMLEGFARVNQDSFLQFLDDGILDKSELAQELTEAISPEYYAGGSLGKRELTADETAGLYVVLHTWASGTETDENEGSPNSAPVGTSHDITLGATIKSWANVYENTKNNEGGPRQAGANYLLGDAENNNEFWRLTPQEFGLTHHAGSGLKDEGAQLYPDVGNSNSVGIEVQADNIYNVEPGQFENIVYSSARILIDSGQIQQGMSIEEISDIVNAKLVGHGKSISQADNGSGIEFGSDYMLPIRMAVAMTAYQFYAAE